MTRMADALEIRVEARTYAAYAARPRYLDTVWLDAAWFAGGFPNGVRNYTFRKGVPNGLRPVSDEVRCLGMKFLLWFEPERVRIGTQMEREYPEWIIRDPDAGVWDSFLRADQDVAPGVPRALCNLAIPEAQAFPDMQIDNCASGGRRIDLETCMRSVPLWRSDTGNAMPKNFHAAGMEVFLLLCLNLWYSNHGGVCI